MLKVKSFLLAMIALAAACTAFPQGNYYIAEPKLFSGGLVAGPNFTQVDGDTFYGYDKVGINAGGAVYVHFTQKIGVSIELLYTQKGSRGEEVLQSPIVGTYATKYFMNLNYMEVPVTFHFISHKFDFEAGLSFAYLVKSREWIEAEPPVTIDPIANRFNNYDVDYIFGLMHQVYKKLYASVRFEYSITSIRPPDRVPLGYGYGDLGQFNNLFCTRLIYWF